MVKHEKLSLVGLEINKSLWFNFCWSRKLAGGLSVCQSLVNYIVVLIMFRETKFKAALSGLFQNFRQNRSLDGRYRCSDDLRDNETIASPFQSSLHVNFSFAMKPKLPKRVLHSFVCFFKLVLSSFACFLRRCGCAELVRSFTMQNNSCSDMRRMCLKNLRFDGKSETNRRRQAPYRGSLFWMMQSCYLVPRPFMFKLTLERHLSKDPDFCVQSKFTNLITNSFF